MAQCSEQTRDHSPSGDRPNMSDLRIVLVGRNASENNRVGNFILNKEVFGKKSSHDVEEHREIVEGRNITVISTTHLLKSSLTLSQITQKVSAVCPPEPYVIILVLQHDDFSKKDRKRPSSVLSCFGEQAMKITMILTTDDETRKKSENERIQQITEECGGRRLQLQNTQRSQILQKVDEIIIREFKTKQGSSVTQEDRRQKEREEENTSPKLDVSENVSGKQKLNLVLCGSDGSLTVSVSKLLQGKTFNPSDQKANSEECVKREERIHDRLISLVELPAVNHLSEEEVMRQTLRCVSLFDPGVHVFLLIIPVGPLTDEDKAEIEKIQKIFDSREHFVVLFISDSTKERAEDFIKHSTDSQRLISLCGDQYRVMGLKKPENSRQIPELLDYIEKMKTEPYSPLMYVKAQEKRVRRETEEKYKEELKRLEDENKELQARIQTYGAEGESDDLECLRIVLIGKTGNGKSATGNTILGRKEFHSQSNTDSVTTVCEKRVGEVDGRSVAVVDTPGLVDTTLSHDQVVEEIMKCVSMSSPGPHVFIIVLTVGRFIQVEADTVDLIKKIFGHKSAQFSIVLFTRGDDLEDESIEDYVKRNKSAELQKLIRDCGNRFLAFNNREKQDKTQVTRLLNMIEEVKNNNEGRYFTNSMFEEAEMSIKKRMEEIIQEREREIQVEHEALKAKYEMEKENMMKRLREEKQRADSDQKEETFRREFEEKIKSEQKKRETEDQKRSEEEKQRRAEYHQRIEEMKREIENQRLQYEKQQREREEEDRKREEKYRQDQEKMKNEQERIIAELQRKQEEEIKKRDLEEKRRRKEEEEERQRWERIIKEAENDRKETQEEIKRQQRKWEDEKKRQMREREEEERKKKEKQEEQLREKQEELEKMRKRFEREREEERQKIEEEREKLRREREEKEKKYEEKRQETIKYLEQLEKQRKEEWERRRREDDEKREEERKRWKKMIEDLKREQEEENKRRETERKEREEMK